MWWWKKKNETIRAHKCDWKRREWKYLSDGKGQISSDLTHLTVDAKSSTKSSIGNSRKLLSGQALHCVLNNKCSIEIPIYTYFSHDMNASRIRSSAPMSVLKWLLKYRCHAVGLSIIKQLSYSYRNLFEVFAKKNL